MIIAHYSNEKIDVAILTAWYLGINRFSTPILKVLGSSFNFPGFDGLALTDI